MSDERINEIRKMDENGNMTEEYYEHLKLIQKSMDEERALRRKKKLPNYFWICPNCNKFEDGINCESCQKMIDDRDWSRE